MPFYDITYLGDGYVKASYSDEWTFLHGLIGWFCVSINNRSMISANIIKHKCETFNDKKEGINDPKKEKPKCWIFCCHKYCGACKAEMERKYTRGQSAGRSHSQQAEETERTEEQTGDLIDLTDPTDSTKEEWGPWQGCPE